MDVDDLLNNSLEEDEFVEEEDEDKEDKNLNKEIKNSEKESNKNNEDEIVEDFLFDDEMDNEEKNEKNSIKEINNDNKEPEKVEIKINLDNDNNININDNENNTNIINNNDNNNSNKNNSNSNISNNSDKSSKNSNKINKNNNTINNNDIPKKENEDISKNLVQKNFNLNDNKGIKKNLVEKKVSTDIKIPIQKKIEDNTFITATNIKENISQNNNNDINIKKSINEQNPRNLIIPSSNQEELKFQKKAENKVVKKISPIKRVKQAIKKPDIIEQNIEDILNKPSKLMSNFDKVEQAYNQLKNPIYDLLSKPDSTSDNEIIKENSKMLKYFTHLNKIVSILSDTKIPPIKKKVNINQDKINNNIDNEKIEKILEENNEKILNNYKKENEKMEKLLKKLKNPEYSNNLVNKAKNINGEIIIYEKKIKDLKSKLKYRDILINRKNKEPSSKENELKRIAYDYNTKKNEYSSLNNKYNQSNKIENYNEKKIKELKEWKENLEKIAKEMY